MERFVGLLFLQASFALAFGFAMSQKQYALVALSVHINFSLSAIIGQLEKLNARNERIDKQSEQK